MSKIINAVLEIWRSVLQKLPFLRAERKLRFHLVDEGKLYRCGQPNARQLQKLIRGYNFSTIVVVRREVLEEEARTAQWFGVNILHYAIWKLEDVKSEMLDNFLEEARKPWRWPILVHCVRGRDRTGLFALAYRIEVQGWAVGRAWEEMKHFGHGSLKSAWFKPVVENRYGLNLGSK